MYRMAMMSFLIKDESVSKEKVMKIALVHDMAGLFEIPDEGFTS